MADNRNSTFVQIPKDLTNSIELRRFLDKLIEQIDVAFGNRGEANLVSSHNFLMVISDIKNSINNNNLSIQTNAKDIATNKLNIVTNKENIIINTDDIATNKNDIVTNKNDIATNKSDIAKGCITTVLNTTIDITLDSFTELALCDCTDNNIIITLPNIVDIFELNKSRILSISKIDNTNNKVSIITNDNSLILGYTSVDLIAKGEIINLITDGTNWYLGA